MTDADPQTPPNEDGTVREEARESGGSADPCGADPKGTTQRHEPERTEPTTQEPLPSSAADRLLPPFLLVQAWEPDAYDEVLLEWWGEGYLMECGSMHADERLAQHDHGRVLALVVVEEDWVEECRLIASS